MGYGFLVLFVAVWLLGWLVWRRILKRTWPRPVVQVGLTFMAAILIWHALVLYPVYDLRRSLSYDEAIRIIEENSEVRFDPFAPVLSLGAGNDLSEGLEACGKLCSRGYCEKGLKQEFVYHVNSYYLRDESGAKKRIPSQSYIQTYFGTCPNPKIDSTKIAISELPINKPGKFPNAPVVQFHYNGFYNILGVKFEILTFNYDKFFRSAHIYMNKVGSWLEGIPDDELGGRDREPIMNFNWLDVLRARQ